MKGYHMESFIDYYKVLQVHYDASSEIIKSVYKKLCLMYHPDSTNSDERRQFERINEAYAILGDVNKRKDYHKQWLDNMTNRDAYMQHEEKVPQFVEKAANSSAEALDLFYDALQAKQYEQAYWYLSEEDKDNIPLDDFIQWRQAVEECYEMVEHSVHFMRNIRNCKIGNTKYSQVSEFAVTVTDRDLVTLCKNTDTIKKYVAYDGASFKVCFMQTSLKNAILEYRLLASKNQNYDAEALYKRAVAGIDRMTGLLSESGFKNEAEKEVARHFRYGNKFSLLYFKVNAFSDDKASTALCNFANIVGRGLRLNDLSCRYGSNEILCLLAETDAKQAEYVREKLMLQADRNSMIKYSVSCRIVEFDNFATLEDAISKLKQ